MSEPFLVPAENEIAFAKLNISGFAKSGKSRTAMEIALGLHGYVKSKKPIAFIDTETGSDWLLKFAKAKKVEILRPRLRSRAFVDLMGILAEAEKLCDIVIVDSVTHFWTDLIESFMRKKEIQRMSLHHWGAVKQEWRPYTDFFLNSKLHFINCGRAGWEFDRIEDEEGFKELTKTGTRMKGEGEMAFEPNLLIEMERVRPESAVGKVGQGVINRMWIIGDRSDTINGKYFDLAESGKKLADAFECILPHIKSLNLGGKHAPLEKGDSQALFDGPSSRSEEFKRREIFTEELKNDLLLRFPGRGDADKQGVIRVLRALYGTASQTALEKLESTVLGAGLSRLRAFPETATAQEVVEALEAEKGKTHAGTH